MENYILNRIRVALFLDNRRKDKNGNYPIKVRVTYRRDRKYYSTGKSLSIEEWEKLETSKSIQLVNIKKELQFSFDKVKEAVQILENNNNFSFDSLNIYLGKCTGYTINLAFKAKIESLIENEQIGTSDVYECAYNHFKNYAGCNVNFESVTILWLKRYEKAMLNEGKSYNTISIYIRCIRALFNDAKASGLITERHYPFGKNKYKIPSGKSQKRALSLSQIKQIIDFTDGVKATEHYRDLWFFSYLCNGININDMLKLKYSNIHGDEIRFYRSKTINTSIEKKQIEVSIIPEMQQIMERWGNPEKSPNNFIFPFLTGIKTPREQKLKIKDITNRINKQLKKIGKALGIPGLSTYTARHSYATVLKRSGVNIA